MASNIVFLALLATNCLILSALRPESNLDLSVSHDHVKVGASPLRRDHDPPPGGDQPIQLDMKGYTEEIMKAAKDPALEKELTERFQKEMIKAATDPARQKELEHMATQAIAQATEASKDPELIAKIQATAQDYQKVIAAQDKTAAAKGNVQNPTTSQGAGMASALVNHALSTGQKASQVVSRPQSSLPKQVPQQPSPPTGGAGMKLTPEEEKAARQKMLKPKDAQWFIQEDLNYMIDKGQPMLELIEGGAFAKFLVSNCKGRWIVDSDKAKTMAYKDAEKMEFSAECPDIEKEYNDCKDLPRMPQVAEQAQREAWRKADKEDKKCGKKLFQLDTPDFQKNWAKNPAKSSAQCSKGGFSMSHYLNKEKYTILLPTMQNLAVKCEKSKFKKSERFGYGACTSLKSQELKLALTSQIVLLKGSGKNADIAPMFMTEFRSRYVDCAGDNKPQIEAAILASQYILNATAQQAKSDDDDDDDDDDAACRFSSPAIAALLAVVASAMRRW